MKKHLQRQLAEDKELIDALIADVDRTEAELKKHSSQFYRRSYVRNLFSFIEAMAFLFRRHAMYSIEIDLQCKAANALKAEKEKEAHVSKWIEARQLLYEWTLLSSDSYYPGKTGKMIRQEQRIPFTNYVALSIRSYSKNSRWFDCTEFFADNGWNDFQKSVKIRNRITHPKTPEEIKLSDADMEIVQSAAQWFLCVVRELGRRFQMMLEGRGPDLSRARKEIAK